MRKALFLGLLISSASVFAQTSFDEYFAIAKTGRSAPREESFSASCGLKRADATISYGITGEGWKWQKKRSLGHGRDDAEADFYGTAVIWTIREKPRFINTWMLIMDTGNTNNEMFCLDEQGRVVAQESLNRVDAVTQDVGWIYLQRIRFSATHKKVIESGQFINEAGVPIAAPKLDHEDAQVCEGVALA